MALTQPIHDEEIRFYSEAIRLKPDFAEAFYNRGVARKDKGDLDGALADYNEAIRLQPDFAEAFNNRGLARKAKAIWTAPSRTTMRPSASSPTTLKPSTTAASRARAKGDLDGALADYDEAIRLQPDFAEPSTTEASRARPKATWTAHSQTTTRPSASSPTSPKPSTTAAYARKPKAISDGALADCNQAIRLTARPCRSAFNSRGPCAAHIKGDSMVRSQITTQAIRLNPTSPCSEQPRTCAQSHRRPLQNPEQPRYHTHT